MDVFRYMNIYIYMYMYLYGFIYAYTWIDMCSYIFMDVNIIYICIYLICVVSHRIVNEPYSFSSFRYLLCISLPHLNFSHLFVYYILYSSSLSPTPSIPSLSLCSHTHRFFCAVPETMAQMSRTSIFTRLSVFLMGVVVLVWALSG